MRIAVVGTGYVGLVVGACFAETGNDVICIDKDAAKVQMLRRGKQLHHALDSTDVRRSHHMQDAHRVAALRQE